MVAGLWRVYLAEAFEGAQFSGKKTSYTSRLSPGSLFPMHVNSSLCLLVLGLVGLVHPAIEPGAMRVGAGRVA